jgi:hypothetical protein
VGEKGRARMRRGKERLEVRWEEGEREEAGEYDLGRRKNKSVRNKRIRGRQGRAQAAGATKKQLD